MSAVCKETNTGVHRDAGCDVAAALGMGGWQRLLTVAAGGVDEKARLYPYVLLSVFRLSVAVSLLLSLLAAAPALASRFGFAFAPAFAFALVSVRVDV